MKNVFCLSLLVIGFLLQSKSSHAVALVCGQTFDETANVHVMVENVGKYKNFVIPSDEDLTRYTGPGKIRCTTLDITTEGKKISFNNDEVWMQIEGKGFGLKAALGEGFMINCPLVLSTKRLVARPFYGVKLSAGAIFGGSVGLFSNKKLGTCVLTGAGLMIGAGISGAKMTFEEVQ